MDPQKVESIRRVYEQEFAQLEADRKKYEHLISEIENLEEGPQGPDRWKDVEAMANRLETLYACFERVSKRIARRLDDIDLRGESWHKNLLHQMSQPTEERSAVIEDETKERLMEFLKFRHYVRKNYVHVIEWQEMIGLVQSYPQIYQTLQEQLNDFVNKLEGTQNEE